MVFPGLIGIRVQSELIIILAHISNNRVTGALPHPFGKQRGKLSLWGPRISVQSRSTNIFRHFSCPYYFLAGHMQMAETERMSGRPALSLLPAFFDGKRPRNAAKLHVLHLFSATIHPFHNSATGKHLPCGTKYMKVRFYSKRW